MEMLQKAPFISFNSPSHFWLEQAGLAEIFWLRQGSRFVYRLRLSEFDALSRSSSPGRVKLWCPHQKAAWSLPASQPAYNRGFQNPQLQQLGIDVDTLEGELPQLQWVQRGNPSGGHPEDVNARDFQE